MNLGHQFHLYPLSCRCRNGAGRFRDCHVANQSRSPKLRSWLSGGWKASAQIRHNCRPYALREGAGAGQAVGKGRSAVVVPGWCAWVEV